MSNLQKLYDSLGWHPIEEHPKDGSQFIVTDGNSIIMAENPDGDIVLHDITSVGFKEPTHFMYLNQLHILDLSKKVIDIFWDDLDDIASGRWTAGNNKEKTLAKNSLASAKHYLDGKI